MVWGVSRRSSNRRWLHSSLPRRAKERPYVHENGQRLRHDEGGVLERNRVYQFRATSRPVAYGSANRPTIPRGYPTPPTHCVGAKATRCLDSGPRTGKVFCARYPLGRNPLRSCRSSNELRSYEQKARRELAAATCQTRLPWHVCGKPRRCCPTLQSTGSAASGAPVTANLSQHASPR